ncbi:MAG: undecaprenyldiphospho-muramoylpentapeptide beta-N-acetylglucosaminyltransferase [Verrucomicrobiota bacterium]
MRFAIAAGGTGGHLFPGLAVAEVLHSRGHEVMVLTSEKHIDAVATEGRSEFRIERLPGVGLPRKLSLEAATFFLRFARGVLHCRSLFADFQPTAVLGMGGFTSTAPILAARLRGTPVFVHESNAIPGKANRLNARIVGGLLVGLQDCVSTVPNIPCTVTGTPIRRALCLRPSVGEARLKFGLDPEVPTILVMGGSQGARGINQAMVDALPLLSGLSVQFVHITGPSDEDSIREAYQRAGKAAWVGAFHHAMQDAYSAASLAVARSGAASLTELAYFQVPSILIPYPFAAEDHQTLNARVFEQAGAAVLMPESKASGQRLDSEIRAFLEPKRREVMVAACAAMTVSDAAERVAEVLLKAANLAGGKL